MFWFQIKYKTPTPDSFFGLNKNPTPIHLEQPNQQINHDGFL